MPACNSVGRFERLGGCDAAFVCDFCDGFLVWPDLLRIPAVRTPLPPGSTYPNWQATGLSYGADTDPGGRTEAHEEREIGPDGSVDGGEVGREKQVVFPPLAIANHLPPQRNDWRARILCPYCDEYTYMDQGGEDSEEEVKYAQDEQGFPDVKRFQEHLEWYHTALPVPPIPSLRPTTSNCRIM